jgi:membrane fusion protein (multidrug efflux system)
MCAGGAVAIYTAWGSPAEAVMAVQTVAISPSARAFPAVGRRLAAVLLAVALAGCSRGDDGTGAAIADGPVAVSVLAARAETVPLTLEYTAHSAGSREVEVRARVSGILERRNYVEGEAVRAGQSLFTIDPIPFELAVAHAEAGLEAAAARLQQAEREAARLKPLSEIEAVSRKAYDDAVSAAAIARAEVLAARARLREARVNLGYTRVEAPIAGITSRALQSEGSLVSGPEVLLTTVTQIDPIHVIFGIPAIEQLRLRREVEQGRLAWPADGRFRVVVVLADGSEVPRAGRVDFTDVRIDRDTGTSEARAELANPDGLLRPGQFVRVRLEGARRPAAFLLPQRALLEGPQGRFVYVADGEDKAAQRPVEVAEWRGGEVVVTAGLAAGERVVVDGLLRLAPGAALRIVPEGAAAPAAPAAAQ